ncbi:hypothetical protein CFD26_108589 [Aspergillus turcosus]|uniref:Uncharacterized protein n=1 Tax=Aspergillus turcosus TaxID=1245748 RepID=A0A3R7IJM3_9EURO|nr:hypothetical protein CFD26_108589 [Aspergillus turcosus]
MSNASYPKDESWILIPKKQGLAMYVSWRQAKVKRREKYFLVNCYWSADEEFTGTVPLWVADVYFEEHFAEEHNLLKGITRPKDHIYKFDQGECLPQSIQDFLDSAENTTFRWVVYHPATWEPKQADFCQGAFTTIAADLATNTAKALTTHGLKVADPSGIVNAGVARLIGWEKVRDELRSQMNTLGHPLRKFGQTGLSEAQEKQMKLDKEEYKSAYDLSKGVVDGHADTKYLGDAEREVLAHVMVTLNLGLQGVAEEGRPHTMPQFVVKPSPFHTSTPPPVNAKPAQQTSLVGVDVMFKQDKVPGHSDAIYDPVPKADQLLSVEFLEVAPTPILSDRFFFAFLRGYLPESKKKELALPDEGLVDATLSVSGSVVYADGSYDDDDRAVTLPFKTATLNDWAHLTIRGACGTQVDYLRSSGRSDILLDFQIPSMFVKSGMWTFKVDARLGDKDNTCLFAMSVTQWLDGGL